MPYKSATYGIHADDRVNVLTDVAPPIHTSTTFRYPRNPDELNPVPDEGEYVVSGCSQFNFEIAPCH